MTEAPETIETETTTVSCDGALSSAPGRPGDELGHPEVFLNMEGAGQVQCPYCSRLFVLSAQAKAAPSH